MHLSVQLCCDTHNMFRYVRNENIKPHVTLASTGYVLVHEHLCPFKRSLPAAVIATKKEKELTTDQCKLVRASLLSSF